MLREQCARKASVMIAIAQSHFAFSLSMIDCAFHENQPAHWATK